MADSRSRVRRALRAVYAVWLRELLRVANEPARVLVSLGQPLIYVAVMGSGLGATFRPVAVPDGFDYVRFVFPGVLGMTVLFTALFSAVSVIWDREFGILKAILIAPVPHGAVVLGKVLGGSTVALLQGSLLLACAPLWGIRLGLPDLLWVELTMFALAFGLSALGLAVASRMASMEGFQAVMSFLVIPLWLLSGAFFPLRGVPGWMVPLMRLDPLTYGVDALRGVILRDAPGATALVAHPLAVDLAVVTGWAGLALALALLAFRSREG